MAERRSESRRRTLSFAFAGIALAALGGCLMLYDGTVEGPSKVVAVRNEPGRPQEAILQVVGRADWNVVVGPDGPGKTHFRSVRYYLASGGKTNSLSHATKWAYDDKEIEDAIPIRGTDRWLLTYADITSADTVTLDVRLFTARKLIAKHEIAEVFRDAKRDDLRGYGVCVVSADGRTIAIPTVEGDCVLDGVTGELTRPPPVPDRAVRTINPPKGVSLYDVAADRILWTVPDGCILSSRTDTDTFITCTSEGNRHTLRLRDGTGAELVRREIACDQRNEMAASPTLKRVAYLVARDGGRLADKYDETRDAALCVVTFSGGASDRRNVLDLGVGRQLEFRWVTDDVLIGTWMKRAQDYDHYEYVVIDAQTGKWHVLPFETNYYRGFTVDVAAGCAYLRGRVYDARADKVTATLDFANPAWPQELDGFRTAGVENGVGVVFAGMRHWMLVGWDGKLVASGALQRKGIVSVENAIGHGRLAVYLKGYEPAVLSLKDDTIIKKCYTMPFTDGHLLIGMSPDWEL